MSATINAQIFKDAVDMTEAWSGACKKLADNQTGIGCQTVQFHTGTNRGRLRALFAPNIPS